MRKLMTVLLAGVAVFCTALPAGANDYLSEVINGLRHSPVYVAPGTGGTDANTASELQQQLTGTDNIVLILLPDTALTSHDDDIQSLAAAVSKAVGSERIIGLAAGDKVVGYSTTMPSGVAPDLMNRAASVSNGDPVVTLQTFVRNVHGWQLANPQAKTTKKSSQDGGVPWLLWVCVALIVIGGIAAAVYLRSNRTDESRKRFKAPERVSDQLSDIAHLREHVNDAELCDTLFQCCTDIERYFQKNSNDKKADAVTFGNHLKSVINVLKKYIEVQDAPRYYDDPHGKLRQGKQSIVDFADYVLKSIKSGNEADLIDYKVDTNILQAKRYA